MASEPPAAPLESLQLQLDPGGDIVVSLAAASCVDSDEALGLLSCWWLRWQAHACCAVVRLDSGWSLRARVAPDARHVLRSLLIDLLAVKTHLCVDFAVSPAPFLSECSDSSSQWPR